VGKQLHTTKSNISSHVTSYLTKSNMITWKQKRKT